MQFKTHKYNINSKINKINNNIIYDDTTNPTILWETKCHPRWKKHKLGILLRDKIVENEGKWG